MKKSLFIILFIFSVVGVFAGIVFHLKWLDYLCKPLIMISIGCTFLQNSKNIDRTIVRFALFAFLFSLSGDTFLMFADDNMMFFMIGLASFLVAQVGYILLFRHTVKISDKQPFLQKNMFWFTGHFIYGGLFYILLLSHLDNVLKIAVFMYMMALFGMSAMALNRFKTVSSSSFVLVFTGSVLFVISDTLIALDKFLAPVPNDRLFVMSTYIAAQYLIMRGILEQFR